MSKQSRESGRALVRVKPAAISGRYRNLADEDIEYPLTPWVAKDPSTFDRSEP